jgi:hypothetical protein
VADARAFRRRDGREVLAQPRAGAVERIGGDEEKPLDPSEGRIEACRFVKVDPGGLQPCGGCLGRIARAGGDVRGAAGEELRGDEAAELARCAGDEQRAVAKVSHSVNSGMDVEAGLIYRLPPDARQKARSAPLVTSE